MDRKYVLCYKFHIEKCQNILKHTDQYIRVITTPSYLHGKQCDYCQYKLKNRLLTAEV